MEIEFFADTASIQEIKHCFANGVDDGITTNPKIIETSGDLSKGIKSAYQSLIEKYPNVPISLETDLRGLNVNEIEAVPEQVSEILLGQAYDLMDLSENVVIKIPICTGGLLATQELTKQGIRTNVTACMTPYQALAAAQAGGTYVSLFANRMLDSEILALSGNKLEEIVTNPEWKSIVKENTKKHFDEAWGKTSGAIAYVAEKLDGTKSKLIVGSIRLPEDIHKIVQAGPQVITIPYGIVSQMGDMTHLKNTQRTIDYTDVKVGNSITHPMTQYTLDEFEKSADKYRK
ncbi:hypothetical protein GOV14_06950 [Candidatus Pacearchaeota archaeon]|nr:hypothetical protein [Candidatus Pacearchaeota archaeon]